MERHRCKLCFRKFANGRALGGHMRSHMMNLPLPPKRGCDTVLSPQCSYYSSSDSENQDQTNSADHGNEDDVFIIQSTELTGSSSLVTLQDRESETESFKKNPTRRRSKRTTSSSNNVHQHYYYYSNCNDSHIEEEHHQPNELAGGGGGRRRSNNNNNRPTSVSPVSSISEVTSDEDLAYCLMMMSRDKWSTNSLSSSPKVNKKKYKCETCNKVFRSYQALGGHRASHKKIRANGNFDIHISNNFSSEVQGIVELSHNEKEKEEEEQQQQQQTQKKVHECPVCFRVFSSGQALGGHKRSHILISGDDYGNSGTNQDFSAPLSNVNDDGESPKKMKMKMKTKMMAVINGATNESLIDLNLPAPVDYGEDDNEEEISQIDDVHL